jgi:hypothetical protein
MAVARKNTEFWDVAPFGSCKNRRFGESYRLIISVTRSSELESTLTAPTNRSTLHASSPILVTLMMETIASSEMSIFTRSTRRHIPEDGILWSSLVVRRDREHGAEHVFFVILA